MNPLKVKLTICCFPICSPSPVSCGSSLVTSEIGRHLNLLRALLSPFVNREAQGGVGKAGAPDKTSGLAGMGVLSAWRAPMKPVLAVAICLMLGSSSFPFRGVAGPVHPPAVRARAVHQAVLAGDTVPVLTGLGATLALVVVK
jgi:hypothetical protein